MASDNLEVNNMGLRCTSISANAVEEMKVARGRGGRRPSDHDMMIQYQISILLGNIRADDDQPQVIEKTAENKPEPGSSTKTFIGKSDLGKVTPVGGIDA